MEEQPQPNAIAEATAPKPSDPSGDETAITTAGPVDTSEQEPKDDPLPQQQEVEAEVQPSPPSDDARMKNTAQAEEIEQAGIGDEPAAEGEPRDIIEQEEDAKGDDGAVAGEGSKTSVTPKNSKSAMVVLVLLEGDEISLEKRVSKALSVSCCLLTHCGCMGRV